MRFPPARLRYVSMKQRHHRRKVIAQRIGGSIIAIIISGVPPTVKGYRPRPDALEIGSASLTAARCGGERS